MSSRCRYVARQGRCKRVATIEGELCRQHAELLARELETGATGVIDSVVSGRASIGDVISGAVTGYVERMFAGSPWLRDLDQAANQAAAQARARRARAEQQQNAGSTSRASSSSPPRSPPRSPPGPGPAQARPPDPALLARMVLGFESTEALTIERIKDRKQQLAKVFHPDRQGGSTSQMQRVNAAADLLIARLSKPKRP